MSRRSGAPSKGDRREQALLDAAEELLAAVPFEEVTVDAIAKGAGISRAAVYFYFGSKQDVLAALVARTMTAVRQGADLAADDAATPPAELAERAARAVARVWQEHGTVMRAAVDHAFAHPDIGAAWTAVVEEFAAVMTRVLLRAGLPDSTGPQGAAALAAALCWMTERTFYRAACVPDPDWDGTAATVAEVWRRVMAAPAA
ncbi:TetR/AcrR family transcriptional regulator [Actinacidiphila guanduensis]|uniref:Transcriptional regulator, TetR family n=1 Tax=Actinacidiphila guanduensis TaxID=310781 RepID=A0A1H0JH90_9ACTN|nr:TetR/AcrR family transcriptional regulator [Actinacidiphila guanduensis]SDO43004.1 transcriptional regulator, TetR family [Actinacidiphila guanduensis]